MLFRSNAPHIRQRLYWVAHTEHQRRNAERLFGYGETARPLGSRQTSSALRSGEDGDYLEDATSSRQLGQRDTASFEIQGQCSIGGKEYTQSRIDGELSGRTEGFCGASLLWPNAQQDRWWDRESAPQHEMRQNISSVNMADAEYIGNRCETKSTNNFSSEADRSSNQHGRCSDSSLFWHDAEYISGADGKTRRVKPGVRLLAHGVPNRVASLRIAGNAIVPQVAAEVIQAYMWAHAEAVVEELT